MNGDTTVRKPNSEVAEAAAAAAAANSAAATVTAAVAFGQPGAIFSGAR